jgi:beta-alanine degradation protein BauB
MPEKQSISNAVGTRLLFENERVRVWDLRLAPGESTGLHRHTTDYLYVVIGDGTLQAIDAEGNPRPLQAMSDGEVRFRTVAGEEIHEAVNVGETPWRNIVIELKEPGSAAREG